MLGYNIAIDVIAIMLGVGGIILGLGYAMDDRKLKAFGREEILQSVINGVIVGALFLFFSPGGLGIGVVNGLVAGSNANAVCQGFMKVNYAICFAHNYLVGLTPVTINGHSYPSLLDDSLGLLIPVSATYVILAIVSSVKLGIGVASISFASVMAPLLSQESFIITTLTFAIMSIYTQSALLEVIAVVAVPLLLPVGIVLRTFYFTRRLGGAIIAIAVGLFTVFPLTYLLDAQITANYSNGTNQTSIGSFTSLASSLNVSVSSLYNATNSSSRGLLASLSSKISEGVSGLEEGISKLIKFVAMLLVEVFFFPVFSVILTTISIRELARILGSEVSFGRFDIF